MCQIIHDDFLGTNITHYLIWVISIDGHEAVFFTGDSPHHFFSDWCIFLKHENTFHGYHSLLDCFVLVIHDLIDEFYL